MQPHEPQVDLFSSDPTRPTERPSSPEYTSTRANDADSLETHTDLPLTQSVNGGNVAPRSERLPTLADLVAALDQAMLVPIAPPLQDVDHRAVVEWARAAARDLLFRDERRRLVREVLRLLDDEWKSAERIESVREQILSRDAAQRAKKDGTYWRRRESGRRAQRPIHVEVERAAWSEARADASRRGLGIGEYVGRLIVGEVAHPSVGGTVGEERQLCRLFARVDVADETWAALVARARAIHVTASRLVGLLVERRS